MTQLTNLRVWGEIGPKNTFETDMVLCAYIWDRYDQKVIIRGGKMDQPMGCGHA